MTKVTKICVLSATGSQGGAVIDALLANKSKMYKIVGTSRNPDGEAAKKLTAKGVNVVKANFNDAPALTVAMKGSEVVFSNTDFWDKEISGGDQSLEVKQGKIICDAAIAAGCKFIIYSSLPSCNVISKGKYQNVKHFDGKAEVAKYIQSKSSQIKSIFVEAGCYMTNFKYFMTPVVAEDGALVWYLPVKPETIIPAIDIASDYGRAVACVIENIEKHVGQFYHIAGEYISFEKLVKEIGKESGKTTRFVQISREKYLETVTPHVGADIAVVMAEVYEFFQDFGYFGGKELSHKALGYTPTTVGDWLKKNPGLF